MEAYWGNRAVAPIIANFGAKWSWVVNFIILPGIISGNNFRWLCWQQSLSGRFGGSKFSCTYRNSNPWPSSHAAPPCLTWYKVGLHEGAPDGKVVFIVSSYFIVATGCGFILNLICCGLQFCLRTAGTCNEEICDGQKNFKHLSGMLQRYNRDCLDFGTKVRFAACSILSLHDSPKKERLSKTCNDVFVYE
jgi:hypothetical protein